MSGTVCGIEIKGHEAFVVALSGTKAVFKDVSGSFHRVGVQDANSQDELRSFMDTMHEFVTSIGAGLVGIKGRATSGEFAAGAVSFKMEALIQLAPCHVRLVHPATLSAFEKKHVVPAGAKFKYLENAFKVAFYMLDEE